MIESDLGVFFLAGWLEKVSPSRRHLIRGLNEMSELYKYLRKEGRAGAEALRQE